MERGRLAVPSHGPHASGFSVVGFEAVTASYRVLGDIGGATAGFGAAFFSVATFLSVTAAGLGKTIIFCLTTLL
jgi:hypothetical protein